MENRALLLPFLLVLYFFSSMLPAAQAIWLTLPDTDTDTKCVSEEIQNNVIVLADYIVIFDDNSHNSTISVKVTSPYGNNLHHNKNTTQG